MALPLLVVTGICLHGQGAVVVPWGTALASMIPAIDAITTILIIKHYRRPLMRYSRALCVRIRLLEGHPDNNVSSIRAQYMAAVVHSKNG